jgi:hypothetical protein
MCYQKSAAHNHSCTVLRDCHVVGFGGVGEGRECRSGHTTTSAMQLARRYCLADQYLSDTLRVSHIQSRRRKVDWVQRDFRYGVTVSHRRLEIEFSTFLMITS